MRSIIKLILEIVPLVSFFIAFLLYGLVTATIVLTILTIVSFVIAYVLEGEVNKYALVTTLLIILFGGLTVYTKDSDFIKLKPTILPIIMAGILIFSLKKKKLIIKDIFRDKLVLSDQAWIKLTYNISYFFIGIAVLNEIIRRNFSDYTWVKFKVFGVLPITAIYFMYLFYKVSKTKDSSE